MPQWHAVAKRIGVVAHGHVQEHMGSRPLGAASISRVCAAGYLGGLAKYMLVQPLDTMTTLFEVSRANQKGVGLIGAINQRVVAKGALSLFSGLKSTGRNSRTPAISVHYLTFQY